MRKSPYFITSLVLFQIAGMAQVKKAPDKIPSEHFLIDQSKPYVYLELDHIGPRIPRSDEEPKQGIWLRFHNNCIVPILVRTFGVPAGSPTEEVGVLDQVLKDPSNMGDGASSVYRPPIGPIPPALADVLNIPVDKAAAKDGIALMPLGYDWYVSSFATLEPGQSLYFSLPRNHVSPKWHVEIPFRFDLKVHSTLSSAHNFVALYEGDISSQ